jgi:hypothetical protein
VELGQRGGVRGFEVGFVPQLGTESERCMSLESSGFPEAVREPETAHPLEPATQASQGAMEEREGLLERQQIGHGGGIASHRPAKLRLRLVQRNVLDLRLGRRDIGNGLARGMVAPGAHRVEIGDQVGRQVGGERFASELAGKPVVRSWNMASSTSMESRGVHAAGW